MGALFLGAALAAPPNPTGDWDLRWNDRSYGIAFYKGDDQPHRGDEYVRPSEYHSKAFVDELASINSVTVTHTDGSPTATISGAGEQKERVLEVENLPSGGWQAAGKDPLTSSVDVSEGTECISFVDTYERIFVNASGNLAYHRILARIFYPELCKGYLASLAFHFDPETAGAILSAANDSGAITSTRIPDLEEVQEVVLYEGTRATS